MLELAGRARGHFVTLFEICMHLIRVKPGHISWSPESSLHFNHVLMVHCYSTFAGCLVFHINYKVLHWFCLLVTVS